jgi:hypothetical protein
MRQRKGSEKMVEKEAEEKSQGQEAEEKGRGAGPRDAVFFASSWEAVFRRALYDLSFLRERGYTETASIKLVGDRYQFHQRQRMALLRSCVRASELREIKRREVRDIGGLWLEVDTFNLVILLETAAGGGVILEGMDGCYRDLSSVHGTYRLVEQTGCLVEAWGQWIAGYGVAGIRWYLDAPVSNSGRLAGLIRSLAAKHDWRWEAEVIDQVDQRLICADGIVVSTDKVILRQAKQWASLGRGFVDTQVPNAWILRLCCVPYTDPTVAREETTARSEEENA